MFGLVEQQEEVPGTDLASVRGRAGGGAVCTGVRVSRPGGLDAAAPIRQLLVNVTLMHLSA